MEEQILGDAKEILESVDDHKGKVTDAKQRLKQEEINYENLMLAIEELKTLIALEEAGLSNHDHFKEKIQSDNIKFMKEARQTYTICQELHPRTTSQDIKLNEALNSLTKTEANFVQDQSKVDALIKSLKEEYANICHAEENILDDLKNEAIISEEQQVSDLLKSIHKIESEVNDLEIEQQTLQLTIAKSSTKLEELEAILSAKKEKNNDMNLQIKSIDEYCVINEEGNEKLKIEITVFEEKLAKLQTEIKTLSEYNSLESEKPQEDLEELANVRHQSLNTMKTTKSEKKQKYKELLENHHHEIKAAELVGSDLEAAIAEYKQKTEKAENILVELKAEEEKLMTENTLSLETLKKYEQQIKYEKQKLKKLMKIAPKHIFTKPNEPKATHKPVTVIAATKKNTTNWDSDGSMDADYNAFIQKSKKLRR